ncbi:hypothetical protein Droror1_Dr00016953 [Drosera rotundifolia]
MLKIRSKSWDKLYRRDASNSSRVVFIEEQDSLQFFSLLYPCSTVSCVSFLCFVLWFCFVLFFFFDKWFACFYVSATPQLVILIRLLKLEAQIRLIIFTLMVSAVFISGGGYPCLCHSNFHLRFPPFV